MMKRPSSYLDRSTYRQDETSSREPPQKTNRSAQQRNFSQTTMDQRFGDNFTSWTPTNSSIIAYSPASSTYVLNLIDPHLTWTQTAQICSIFGRVTVHGYVLRPLTFYTIHNYRTNRPLTINLLPSTDALTISSDIRKFLEEYQIDEKRLNTITSENGDLLLIRRFPIEQQSFLKMMQDNQFYSRWFSEKYSTIEALVNWRQIERDLHIRFTEPSPQNAVVPNTQFIEAADQIIRQWKERTTETIPFVVLVTGEKDMGKSTFTRYLVNRATDQLESNFGVTYFDCDIGQCEFTMGGCLSYVHLQQPLFGPPCSHIRSNPNVNHLLYFGHLSPQQESVRYLQYVDRLRKLWNTDHNETIQKQRTLLIVNTMGWVTGLGLSLLTEIICMCCPDIIVKITSNTSDMPNITSSWLKKEPVFLPYRRKIGLNHKRTADYDGELNYELIQLESVAVPSTAMRNQPQLRPRDHRILATWSYFFSSNLLRISLPSKTSVHVSLLDNRTSFPDTLENSLVALCISDKIDQLVQLSTYTNGIYQLKNVDNIIFDCLGFGWVNRYNQETESYEIYTPIIDSSQVNLLVLGTFDTPQEFPSVFKALSI